MLLFIMPRKNLNCTEGQKYRTQNQHPPAAFRCQPNNKCQKVPEKSQQNPAENYSNHKMQYPDSISFVTSIDQKTPYEYNISVVADGCFIAFCKPIGDLKKFF